jgi:hypothetical protein
MSGGWQVLREPLRRPLEGGVQMGEPPQNAFADDVDVGSGAVTLHFKCHGFACRRIGNVADQGTSRTLRAAARDSDFARIGCAVI